MGENIKIKPAKKPPLGIMPKKLWIHFRKKAILEAMQRYVEADWIIEPAWIEELKELNEQ